MADFRKIESADLLDDTKADLKEYLRDHTTPKDAVGHADVTDFLNDIITVIGQSIETHLSDIAEEFFDKGVAEASARA